MQDQSNSCSHGFKASVRQAPRDYGTLGKLQIHTQRCSYTLHLTFCCQSRSQSSVPTTTSASILSLLRPVQHQLTVTMAANASDAVQFYDIAMRVPASPNPWKTRLALNFKGIAHTTKWVSLKDIPQVRRGLGVPACRKHASGEEYYTLPVLVDGRAGAKVGDTFDIAKHLQETYPSSGAGDLFPATKLDFTWDEALPAWAPPLSERPAGQDDELHAEYARFNSHVDAAFSVNSGLMGSFMELDSEESKAVFLQRAGLTRWEQLEVNGEMRDTLTESLRRMMGKLAVLFERDPSGPFVLGTQACYADLIVGGWLHMMQATLPEAEWQAARGWHGGVFGTLYDALEKYAEIK